MPKSQVESAALVAAALAATLALTLLLGPFAWMGSIAGLILLLVLFAYDQEGYRTVLGSLAYSAVCGFCLSVACGSVFKLLAGHGEVHLADEHWATEYLPLTFVFVTALLWAIDRSRMGARQSLADQLTARPRTTQRSFIRDTESFAPAAPQATPYVPPPPPAEPPPAPSFAVREPYETYSQEPIAPQPVYAPPPPAPAPPPPPPAPLRPQSMLTPTTSEAVRPAPVPIIPRGGKEVMIYVALIGEGLNVMRSVRAEHLGRDYYSIIDTMPEGETWQFQPGQVVRCKKQTLSTGKALVAFEEAPRA